MVSDDVISKDVRDFVTAHIRSVVQLELLLLLQADPDREWTSAELANELRIAPDWAERESAELARRGLLMIFDGASPRFGYAAPSAEVNAAVEELARTYAERRVSLIEFLYSAPSGRIQSFADAFRLKKDPSDG